MTYRDIRIVEVTPASIDGEDPLYEVAERLREIVWRRGLSSLFDEADSIRLHSLGAKL